MESLRSIRSCNRARTSERGFALAIALIVAVLYFGLIQLMLFDGQRELAEARRFRARIVAATLAENGAELAAQNIIASAATGPVFINDEQGLQRGKMIKMPAVDPFPPTFVIEAEGETVGVIEQKATVKVWGQISGTDISINYTHHSQ